MSIAQTSLEAFNSITPIKKEGMYYKIIQLYLRLNNTPLSNKNISVNLEASINRITPRVNELRKLKVLEYAETKPCKYTLKNVMYWQLNETWYNYVLVR